MKSIEDAMPCSGFAGWKGDFMALRLRTMLSGEVSLRPLELRESACWWPTEKAATESSWPSRDTRSYPWTRRRLG